MPERSNTKRSCDPNKLAYQIMLESTGQAEKFNPKKPADPNKNPHAVVFDRLGGLKGGAARAAALGPRKRAQIAAKAAKARWGEETVPKSTRLPSRANPFDYLIELQRTLARLAAPVAA
jgi:hypothetical protein